MLFRLFYTVFVMSFGLVSDCNYSVTADLYLSIMQLNPHRTTLILQTAAEQKYEMNILHM